MHHIVLVSRWTGVVGQWIAEAHTEGKHLKKVPMIPPKTFNTAAERQAYHASLPVSEKRSWIEQQFDKERRAQIRRNERESARKVAFLKDLYRRKEEQEAAEQVKAMVERNSRAAALLKRTTGYVSTVPFRGQPAVNRAIREAQ